MFGSPKIVDAAYDGDLKKLIRLLENGADVNARDEFPGNTALIWATECGYRDIVQHLLTQPVLDVNAGNLTGNTALMLAARGNLLDIVQDLLADPRININQQSKHGVTALINAAGMGHKEIVVEFLKRNDISLAATYTDKKHTPMSIARQNGHEEIAAMLEDFLAKQQAAPTVPKAKKRAPRP